jgi:hypothetical protein
LDGERFPKALPLATRIEASTVSFTMADDSMEISSEHGHGIGEDDIDIDIDLTVGQVDEDYIIEDAASNADFRNDFHPQPSPAIGHDDLMIDEDIDSYPMDDADLFHDEGGQTFQAELMSFATGEDSNFGQNLGDTIHSVAAATNIHEGLGYDQQQISENGLGENNPELEDSEDPLHDEDLHHHVEADQLETTEAAKTQPTLSSGTPSPHNRSPHSVTAAELRNLPASLPEPGVLHLSPTSKDSEESPTSNPDALEISNTAQATSPRNTDGPAAAREVIVVYKSVEYALFSTSELDDPDSYFLSDRSIIEKPLPDFFKAIRDIVHEELADEDELCISVEDLGLETEEVSCTEIARTSSGLMTSEQTSLLVQDVSLARIMDLHEKLLQNDGVESSRPLCILLGTRINFARRLVNLTTGADQGKGLSELITWDDQSESLNESGEADESNHDVEFPVESRASGVIGGEETAEGHSGGVVDENAQEEVVSTEKNATPPETRAIEGLDVVSTIRDDLTQEPVIQNPELTRQGSSLNNPEDSTGGELDEDGDLIDYSDEEIELSAQRNRSQSQTNELEIESSKAVNGTDTDLISPCLLPNTCFCPKCNDLLVAKYEAINEEFGRRRSHSRPIEDNSHPETTEQQPANLNDGDEQTYPDEKDGDGYGEHAEEGVEDAAANGDHQDFIVEEFDTGISHEIHEHGSLLYDFNVDQEYDEDGGATYSRIEFGIEEEGYFDENTYTNQGDEFDLEDNDPLPQTSERATEEDSFRENEDLSPANEKDDIHNLSTATNVAASSLGNGDAAESSATASGDEIHYDDEENEEDELDEEVFDDSKTKDESYLSTEATSSAGAVQKDEIDYEDDEDEDEDEKAHLSTRAQAISSPTKELSPTNGKRSRAELESDDGASTRSKGVYGPPNAKRRMN